MNFRDILKKMPNIGQKSDLKKALDFNPVTLDPLKCHRSISQGFSVRY